MINTKYERLIQINYLGELGQTNFYFTTRFH